MSAELFVFDRARLHLVTEADPTGYVGGLESPTQACRAVFLAAEISAIRWDDARWPELEFGIWCDEPEPVPSRRRRAAETITITELSIWLQLRPTWPQLGGPSISWPPLNTAAGPEGYIQRLDAVVEAAVEALNTTYRRTVRMGEVLVNLAHSTTNGANGYHDVEVDDLSTTAFAPVPLDTPPATAQVFTTTAVASSEHEIADVLATLVREATEWASATFTDAVLTYVDHAVTPLPRAGGNGYAERFLVSLTATTSRV